jgi:hypothetical protein
MLLKAEVMGEIDHGEYFESSNIGNDANCVLCKEYCA